MEIPNETALGIPRFIGVSPYSAEESGNEASGRVSTKPGVLSGLDPKPGELPMARLKSR